MSGVVTWQEWEVGVGDDPQSRAAGFHRRGKWRAHRTDVSSYDEAQQLAADADPATTRSWHYWPDPLTVPPSFDRHRWGEREGSAAARYDG